jgi:hypothetical protein
MAMLITRPTYPQTLAAVGFPSSVARGIHVLDREQKAQILVEQANEILESIPESLEFKPDAATRQWLQSLNVNQRLILMVYLINEIGG